MRHRLAAELSGTLYRNGPSQRFKPRGDYHLFAGDGMAHAFHIKDGRVDYRNRWGRTAKWNIEDMEGRAVLNAMNPFDCEPESSDFTLVDKEGLAMDTNFDTYLTSLLIFDALGLASGPLATVRLHHRIPAGLHGFWRQND